MKINVVLSAYEGDCFPDADDKFEDYVLAELKRQYPDATIDVSTAQGRTTVFIDGEPNGYLAREIANDWWATFCVEVG